MLGIEFLRSRISAAQIRGSRGAIVKNVLILIDAGKLLRVREYI